MVTYAPSVNTPSLEIPRRELEFRDERGGFSLTLKRNCSLYARHAADYERIELGPSRLSVEVAEAERSARFELAAELEKRLRI